MNAELMGMDWLGRGWLLLLAFTLAVMLVAVLRRPCRRVFGAEPALQLWLLPPLAMLASQWPHATTTSVNTLPPVLFAITSAVTTLPSQASDSTAWDWRSIALALWSVGVALSLLLATLAQHRYRRRLHGATPVPELSRRWPVLRAQHADMGPALVGAWRPLIVLPSDFDDRYDHAERELILAHELTHARRRDGWWSLLARMVAALYWFHPLVWWALTAFRHDQELACDAAVLRHHQAQRRSYAHAMLKTQSTTFALPVGCPWSPRHPITERIAMLKFPVPNRLRRSTGLGTIALAGIALSAAVYAAGQTGQAHQAQKEAVDEAMVLMNGAESAVAAFASEHHAELPANNAAAQLPDDPNLLSGKYVRRLTVIRGVLVADLRDKPFGTGTAGSVRLLPHVDAATHSTSWTCESADIANIHALNEACVFSPSSVQASVTAKPASGSAASTEYQFNMALELKSESADRTHSNRATVALCAAANQTSELKIGNFDIQVFATPDRANQLVMNLAVSSVDQQKKWLAVRRMGALGETLHQNGNIVGAGEKFSLEITPVAGCPARASGSRAS